MGKMYYSICLSSSSIRRPTKLEEEETEGKEKSKVKIMCIPNVSKASQWQGVAYKLQSNLKQKKITDNK